MIKFNTAYDLIIEDIIQSVTPAELKDRQKEYSKIKMAPIFEKLLKDNKMTKNKDGSYDVDSNLNLENIDLTSLADIQYKLNKINGNFDCSWNNLTSLEGCPKIVTGIFNCTYNDLNNLIGCPKEVGKHFYCADNNLTTLEGCPNKINGSFDCSFNNLTDLKGCPTEVADSFVISFMTNANNFKEEDIRKVCNVKGIVFNDTKSMSKQYRRQLD